MAFNLKNFKVIVQMGKSRGNENGNGSANGHAVSIKEGIQGFLQNTGVGHSSKFVLDEKLLAKLPTEFREQAEQFKLLLWAVRTQQGFVIPVSNSCWWKICARNKHLTK